MATILECRPRPEPAPAPPCPVRVIALALAVAATACGGRASIFDEDWDVTGPVALASHVAYLDRTREELVTVRPVAVSGGFAFDVRRHLVGRNPAFVTPSADGSRALVVTHGTAGGPGLEPEGERLYLVDPSGAGTSVVYDLHSPFDALALSEDGRYAVAYFGSPGAVNPNEIAVVRLDRPRGEANPTLRSLRSPAGSRPLEIRFLLDLPVNGVPRQVAMALSENYVTLFDLESLDRRDTTVFLTVPGGGGATVWPQDIVVASDHVGGDTSETPYVFLRAASLREVYSLAVYPVSGVAEDQNDFRPVVNEISVPDVPTDFTVFTRPAATPGDRAEIRLLTVNASGSAARAVSIIDPRTTNRWDVSLETPATRVLTFEYVDREGDLRHVALLWDDRSTATTTRGWFLDLDDVEDRLSLNLRAVDFGAAVASVVPTADPVRVLLVHQRLSKVSVLNVAERTVDQIGATVPLNLSAMHPDGSTLFFARPGTLGFSVLDLLTMHDEAVRLDATPRALFALPGDPSDGEGRALVVDQGWSTGYLTALPLDTDIGRRDASSIQGFLAEGLLDIDTDHYAGREVEP